LSIELEVSFITIFLLFLRCVHFDFSITAIFSLALEYLWN
jgi:hypothetical protein